MSKLPLSTIDHPAAYTGPPRVLLCAQCSTRIAHTSRLVSTAYRGHAGQAALFTETRNIALDPPSILLMDSGAYTIQEFICQSCEAYLGWKFVRAHDGPERWKEGHYILELDLVLEHDAPRSPSSAYAPDEADASPVETDAAQQAAEAAGLHKRTLSSDPRPPKGVGQGHRSLQVGAAKQQKTPTPGQRKLEVDDYDGGPFWKPR